MFVENDDVRHCDLLSRAVSGEVLSLLPGSLGGLDDRTLFGLV